MSNNELADIVALKDHCKVDGESDDVALTRALAAARAHAERFIGYRLNDATEFPDGTPDDLVLAVLMLAADWFENREASLVGLSVRPLPIGVSEVFANYRRYTFGLSDGGGNG